ncbi:hypothetical protein Pth03_61700 [Planotetraspora thailandica]|uniref:Uncharacterized protein n=1 Tax=Planotetraspora thailandica TaxID=487172 RepID=A0A8J3VA36_9ACTN|nr:hypothetical protein [Planotetraspora thailandica]GII57781.1 hypothetical protein Pth03_61700 [Planotetraspora thailandica]
MSRLENELRTAMAQETATLRAAPDLADRVVRRSRRRRARRMKLVAAAAAVVVAAGAVPAFVKLSRPDQTVSDRALAEVDGVEVHYLPPDLGKPERLTLKERDNQDTIRLWGQGLRWSAGDRFVQVSVYRPKNTITDVMDIWGLNILRDVDESTANQGFASTTDHTDRIWVAQPGVVLRVITSVSLKGDLDRIAKGLRVSRAAPNTQPTAAQPSRADDPLSFAGVRLGRLPDGFTTEQGDAYMITDGIGRWFNRGGGSLSVEVVWGDGAHDLDSLREATVWPNDERLVKVRESEVREIAMRGTHALEGTALSASRHGGKGRMLLWVIRPGLGVRIWASPDLVGTMPEIARGITPIPPLKGDAVAEVRVPYVPEGLRPDKTRSATGPDWVMTARRWRSPADPARQVSVEVYHGGAVEERDWAGRTAGVDAEPDVIGGVEGMVWRSKREQRFAWRDASGLGVAVGAGSRTELAKVVEGIRASA